LLFSKFDHDRFIHSIKTALAVLIGFGITRLIHFHVDQWLVITILVVMCAQMNVGSILQKSYMRFLGSLAGSLIAVFALTFLGSNFIATIIVISLATLFFSYIATSQKPYNDAGTLGVVTVAIILIGPNPSLTTAAERFLEISIGILIAALVSQFILPIHARSHLRVNQSRTIRLLRDYYQLTLCTDFQTDITKQNQNLDEEIVKFLITQRKLATDASRELLSKTYNTKLFKQSLWCEKEILRSMIFMHHAYLASDRVKELLNALSTLKSFNQQVLESLEEIAKKLSTRIDKDISPPNILLLKESIHSMIKILTPDEITYVEAFLFSAEILCARIETLISLQAISPLPATSS